MADTALSALSSATALDGTELYYTVQGGADRKATGDQIRARVIAYLTSNGQTFSTAQTFVGSGAAINIGSNGGSVAGIRMYGASTGDITIRPNSVSSSGVIFQLPANFGGTNSVMVQANSATGQVAWAAATGGGDMLAANNLSEVNSITAFNTIKQAATTASTGAIEIATNAEAVAGTDSVRAVTPLNLSSATVMQGIHTIGLPMGAWKAKTTQGATARTYQDVPVYSFNGTTSAKVRTAFRWPKSWDESTIAFALSGVVDTLGSTGNIAVFNLAGKCFSPTDTAWTTANLTTGAQPVTLAWAADDAVMMSSFSAALTIDGTPTEGDLVVLDLWRDPAAASDNNTADFLLVEASLKYGVNQATDS